MRDTGGSELANTQSFINGLCQLIGVDPPHGSRTDDSQNDYVFERRVFHRCGKYHVWRARARASSSFTQARSRSYKMHTATARVIIG